METLSSYLNTMIHNASASLYYFRRQNNSVAYRHSSQISVYGEKYIEEAVRVGFSDSVELLLPILQLLLEMTESGDVTALADVYEGQLLPALYDIQNCIIENMTEGPKIYWDDNLEVLKQKDNKLYEILINSAEDTTRNYIFTWASSGDPVLKVETDNGIVQLHSGINPWQEAHEFCIYNENDDADKCLMIGLGMGYHVERMAALYPYKEITVLENDLEQLRILFMYRDITKLLKKDNVHIVYAGSKADYTDRIANIKENEECIIYYPSIKTIRDDSLREILENYWINLSSIKNHGKLLERNFSKNIASDFEDLNKIKDDFKEKSMILVAGGPSLDDDMDTLKKVSSGKEKYSEKVVIAAVGKVAKKLIDNGIMPDHIIMTDPKAGTIWQIKGIEECGVPLLALSTTASNVIESYKGKCYMAFQEGFDKAEEFAKSKGYKTFNTGGSVATFAIDMAIRMHCKKVICVGMDMAYTKNRTHASGIGHEINDTKSLRQVRGVDGGMVYTGKTLDIYRKWIEERINNEKNTIFINASKGAKIEGMKEIPLAEVV